MKKVYFFSIVFLFPLLLFSQQDNLAPAKDSLPVLKIDSSLIAADTTLKNDTTSPQHSPLTAVQLYHTKLSEILHQNIYLNSSGRPERLTTGERRAATDDLLFYIIAGVLTLIAFFRYVYARYLNTVFRVFFNTSLRQSQLTDQLLQAKQPSMFFNLMFTCIGGIYIYLLLRWYNWLPEGRMIFYITVCAGALLLIYIIKFIVLKFTGWVTGYNEAVGTYIFIIFLINKILGILLIPFIVVLAFADSIVKLPAAIISLLLVGLMFLLRFFRSFGLLQNRLKVSRFHFFLYIVGVEILPLLLIYKGLLVLLSKNL